MKKWTGLLIFLALPCLSHAFEKSRISQTHSGIVTKSNHGVISKPGTSAGNVLENIQGLLFDFDAAQGITLNGSDVSRWVDRSPYAHIATQSAAGNQPVYTTSNDYFNGLPTVDFHKGSTEWLGLIGSTQAINQHFSNINSSFTVFMVARKPIKVTAEEIPFSLGNLNTGTTNYYGFSFAFNNSNTQRLRFRVRGTTNTAETAPFTLDDVVSYAPVVLCWSSSGTNVSQYVMGETQRPTYDITVPANPTSFDYSVQGTFNVNRYTIGAFGRNTVANPTEMELARLIVYARQLSDSERADISAFLYNKYIDTDPEIEDIPDIAHNWDASQLTEGYGALVSTFTDQVAGINFRADLTTRPVVARGPNGLKVLEFDGINDVMTAGSASDWRVLHDTNSVSVFVVYRVIDENRDSLEPILDTVNSSHTTNIGMGMYDYNVGGSSHTFTWLVGAASTGAVINWKTLNHYAVPQEWHIASFQYEYELPTAEENFKFWIDNELSSFGNSSTDSRSQPSASNPTNTLTLGKLASTNTYAKIQVAQILIFRRNIGWRYETSLINKALARKWGIGISVPMAGNGMGNRANDSTPHRGFPAMVIDSSGNKRVLYRRGVDHGSSPGSAIEQNSTNGIDWPTSENVIATGEVRSGVSDWRIGSGYERITSGVHDGRLCWATEVSSQNSGLVPGSVYVGYSDDGSNWTTVNVNPDQIGFDLNGSAAGMKWLQSGRMLLTFAASQPGEGSGDQDIYITTSADCATWSTPTVLIDHDDITYRITETAHVQYEDGMILTLWRDDTNHVIYKSTTTDDYVTYSSATAFSGWGWPNNALDENERLYVFYRSETLSNVAVWRYSDDRGLNWSAERVLSTYNPLNNASVEYSQMSYTDVKKDADGNLWIAYGLESGDDSDIFARKFRLYPVTSTTTINGISGVVRWYSTAYMGNSVAHGGTLSTWTDLSATGDDAIVINSPTYDDVNNELDFDGSNDYLTITETSYPDWTIFFSASSDIGPILSVNATGDVLYFDGTSGIVTLETSSGLYVWTIDATSDYDVITINSEGSIWVNGVPGTATAVPSTTDLVVSRVGGTPIGNFFFGSMRDILIADEVLSAANMNTIGEYLAGRSGKTWSEIP